MIIYDKPPGLWMNSETWRIDARTRSGGETLTGREQVISSGRGRWSASITFAGFDPASIRTIRALVAKLEGRANAVRIGPCDCSNAPPDQPLVGGIPYGDGAFHSDTSGFSQGGVPPSVTEAALAGAFAVKVFVGSTAVPIPEGVYIGLAGRLYMVVGYAALPSETAQLDILPRLRTDVPEGETVLWCGARCPMRFTADDSGALPLQLARYGSATFDMVEADY